MKRKTIFATVVLAATVSWLPAAPAVGQTRGCAAFGQNISFLATQFGEVFGQTAASGAPLNDTVDAEQGDLCQ